MRAESSGDATGCKQGKDKTLLGRMTTDLPPCGSRTSVQVLHPLHAPAAPFPRILMRAFQLICFRLQAWQALLQVILHLWLVG